MCHPLISIPVFAPTDLMWCCMIRLIQYGCLPLIFVLAKT